MNKSSAGRVSLLLFLFLVPLFFVKTPYILHVLIMILVNIMLVSSLRLIDNTGQLSLCHGGMMSIGAYASALLVMKMHVSFWAALPMSGLFVLVFAGIVGSAFARLKGVYFAMATLFLTEVIRLVEEQWRSLTDGVSGLIGIPLPNPVAVGTLVNIDFSQSRVYFYYLILCLTIVTVLILYAIEHSRIHTTFLCIKQNASLAESTGINATKFKVLAFGIGSFFAGIAGSFYSHYIACINPETFGLIFSLNLVIYMVVGGASTFTGPMIGAVIFTLVPEIFRDLKEYMPLVFAGILVMVIFFLPDGLVSLPRALGRSVRERSRRAGNPGTV
ncbi:MAG: branched-chain amino acid ABC transporter permease [Thermodesulfobacteriota bacterium]